MHSLQIKFLFRVIALASLVPGLGGAQTQDSSGNGLLKGSFRFRHVAVQNVDFDYNPTQITAVFGAITFDGAGKYTLTGTSVDNTVSAGAPQPLNLTGTYAIGSNGLGYLTNELYPADSAAYIYGAAAQGIFTGSSTESNDDGNIFNDIFIAIPLGSPPTNATFTTPYQTAMLDFTGASSAAIRNALFELAPDGKGGFGAIALNGQAADQSAITVMQTVTGASYNFNSDGSGTLTIPPPSGVSLSDALFTGSRTIFQSADGNFILGWTAAGYDVIFGVKALTVTGTNSISQGLYFTAALEDASDYSGTDSYYGGISLTGDSAGDAILHQRLNLPLVNSFDYGAGNQIDVNPDGTTPADVYGYEYVFGNEGKAFVGIGTQGVFSLVVGLHAPAFSGTGVYLNPIGVANAASFQPVTASLAPGELITLYGTGLTSTTLTTQGGQAFPTTLGGVSVSIDGILCPIFYVSPTQLSVIVPYAVASNQTGLANIQVTSNGVQSNVVQMYLSDSAPGSFSQGENGTGYAAAVHTATNALITAAKPAQPGEYISLYLTGLGTVTPAIADGAVVSSSPLSWSDLYNTGYLTVNFNDFGANGSAGNAGNVQFAGLAPSLAGLYQINVQVPTTGLGAGDDVYIEFITDAADVNEIQIPYGSVPGGRTVETARPPTRASRILAIRSQHRKPAAHRLRRTGS